mmetsp:Transcript_18158/g.34267  ORF Transcript_18158/g.34267 Transcript_18158/m.34267 type:complete len:203 (-) Transcript_18158:601-1209(-)
MWHRSCASKEVLVGNRSEARSSSTTTGNPRFTNDNGPVRSCGHDEGLGKERCKTRRALHGAGLGQLFSWWLASRLWLCPDCYCSWRSVSSLGRRTRFAAACCRCHLSRRTVHGDLVRLRTADRQLCYNGSAVQHTPGQAQGVDHICFGERLGIKWTWQSCGQSLLGWGNLQLQRRDSRHPSCCLVVCIDCKKVRLASDDNDR